MSTEPFSLAGRVAIVTGGTRGIGFGIAEGLLRAGAGIIIAGRGEAPGHAAAARLRDLGGEATFYRADITRSDDAAALVRQALEKSGRLDILVNNAGINISNRPENISVDEFNQIMATNLTGALLCAQAAYPAMCRQKFGKIINLGSNAAVFGSATGAAYAASKGGIVQLSKSLAVAWGRDNIQVNAILPGYIESDLLRQTATERPGLLSAIHARTPLGRLGHPHDVAGITVFLASAAADFITGAAIPVDGGYSVQI